MVRLESEASETTRIDPVKFPPEVGLNAAPKVTLRPGFRVSGRVNPVTLKPAFST